MVRAGILYPQVNSGAILFSAHAASRELVLDSLGRFPLESGLMSGLQDSMWAVLSHSAVTEKFQVVAARIRTRVVQLALNVGQAR